MTQCKRLVGVGRREGRLPTVDRTRETGKDYSVQKDGRVVPRHEDVSHDAQEIYLSRFLDVRPKCEPELPLRSRFFPSLVQLRVCPTEDEGERRVVDGTVRGSGVSLRRKMTPKLC